MYRLRLLFSFVLIGGVTAVVGGQAPKTQDAVKFDLKLEKNKSFYQQMSTEVTQVIKVMGQDLTQKQDSTFSFKWTPTKQEGDKWELTDEIESVKMSIDISGNKISYDSAQADGGAAAGNPGLMDFFKKLIGAKFTVTFDTKTMKVDKVDGVQEFLKNLGGGTQQMDAVLKSIMTEDAVKQMCDPTFGLMPDGPKKPGDKWKKPPVTLNLGPIGSYTVEYNFTFVGVEKDLDKIEVEPTLTYTAPKADAAAQGLLFRIKEGSLTTNKDAPARKGVVLYNPKTQRIESADIEIKLKGELTVTIGMADTKVELFQTQVTKFQTSDAPFHKK